MKYQRVMFSLKSNCGFLSLVLSFVVFVAGCSATPKQASFSPLPVRDAYSFHGHVRLVDLHSGGRPEWTRKSVFEENGNIYFTGVFLHGSDYMLSIRCANAEALKLAAQSISQVIRSEFTEYVQGSNSGSGGVERYVEDGIATFVNNLYLQGVRQKEVYCEELPSQSGFQSTYNVFVILEMTKGDYLKAKTDVLRKLRNTFSREGEVEAKEKAERLLEDLKTDVRKGSGNAI